MYIKKLVVTLVTCFVSSAALATPTVIDFEDLAVGAGGDSLVVSTDNNKVTFKTSTNALVAGRGGNPMEGFVVRGAPDDNPAGADNWGRRFLTDETTLGGGLDGRGTYRMRFANAISDLAVEAADYRADGGGRNGDRVSLTVFDADKNILDSVFYIVNNQIDGYLHRFFIENVGDIYSAVLRTSGRDVGTGIDNIAFTSVPEPGTLGLLGLGLLGLALAKRRST